MEQAELQPLYDSYHRKIAKVDLRFKRYLYSQINWKARIISIKAHCLLPAMCPRPLEHSRRRRCSRRLGSSIIP